MMNYLIIIFISYALGCSNMAYYIGKIKHVDVLKHGSKNPGASNSMLLFGWKYGILVGIHDIGKSALAAILATILFPELPYAAAVAGVSSVLGHMFPLPFKFHGGKGFASFIGMMLALDWKFGLIILCLVVLVTLVTDYIVLGTTLTITALPTYYFFTTKTWVLPAIICIATIAIIYKHRMNYVRIYKGTEIGFRSANRGEHRA